MLPLNVIVIWSALVALSAAAFATHAVDTAAPPPASSGPHDLSAPFVGGQGGYPVYRIPALVVSKAGTLLALAEGRASKSDHAQNDIVLRRSTDGGQSWQPLQVVVEDGRNCLNNPTAVVLRDT